MGWVELGTALLTFLILMFKELFSDQARAREENMAYVLTQDKARELFGRALEKMREQAKSDSGQAGSVEDRIDQDQKAIKGKEK